MFFRIQAPNVPAETLIDPDRMSENYNGRDEDHRAGTSVCRSLEELATYLAQSGVQFAADWNVIECDGDYSEDIPCDADMGEVLIHVDRIINVWSMDEIDFHTMISDAYDAIYA